MSLKRILCVASISSAAAMSLYGVGCSSSSPGNTGGKDSGSDSVINKDAPSMMKDAAQESLPMLDVAPPPMSCSAMSSVTVTPTLHATPPATDCTPAIIDQILQCFSTVNPDASDTACSSLIMMPAYSTCYGGCMVTETLTPANDQTASSAWGGEIVLEGSQGYVGYYNLGGCVAALDPSADGQACATAIEANIECLTTACNACTFPASSSTMVTPDGGDVTGYANCEGTVEPNTGTGACTATAEAVTTACATETTDASPGPGAVCFDAVETLETLGHELQEGMPTDPSQWKAAFKVLFGAICAPALVTDGGPG